MRAGGSPFRSALLASGLAFASLALLAPSNADARRLDSAKANSSEGPPGVSAHGFLRTPRSFRVVITGSPRMELGGGDPEGRIECFRNNENGSTTKRRRFEIDGETRYERRIRPTLRHAGGCNVFVAVAGDGPGELVLRLYGSKR